MGELILVAVVVVGFILFSLFETSITDYLSGSDDNEG